MARRRIRGVNRLRQTLRRIEPEVTGGVRSAIEEGIKSITRDAKVGAPRDQGRLVEAIDYKISRDGLTAVSGPGAKAAEIVRRRHGSAFARPGGGLRLSRRNKSLLFQYFKGYWAEFGTKGNREKNIPEQRPRPFMQPAYDTNEKRIKDQVKREVDRALEIASRGPVDD